MQSPDSNCFLHTQPHLACRNRRAHRLGRVNHPLSLEELLPPLIPAQWARKAPPRFSRRQVGCRSPYLQTALTVIVGPPDFRTTVSPRREVTHGICSLR